MQSTGNINSAINSNKEMFKMMTSPQMSSNKQYVSNTLNYTPTQYYNDEVIIKKQKRKKLAKGLIIGSASLIGAVITAGAIFSGRRQIKSFSTKFGKMLDCGLTNFTNIKDDAWQIVQEKTAGKRVIGLVDKIGNWYTNTYKSWADNARIKNKFNAQIMDMKELAKDKTLSKYVSIEQGKLPENFTTFFKNVNEDQMNALDKMKQGKQRICQNLIDFEQLKQKPKEELRKLFNNLTSTKIANDKFSDVYDKNLYIIQTDDLEKALTRKKAQLSELKKLKDCDKAKIEDLNKQIKELQSASKRIKAFNSNQQNIADKLRDINIGNAPTDLIGQAGVVGALGCGIAMADTSKERIAKTTDVGVPLIVGLATSIWATGNYIVGLPMMALSFATGQIAKIVAKTTLKVIDNATNKETQV